MVKLLPSITIDVFNSIIRYGVASGYSSYGHFGQHIMIVNLSLVCSRPLFDLDISQFITNYITIARTPSKGY